MNLLAAVAAVSSLLKPRYRPEAYYMRGPGPACAAKRRAREAALEQSAAPSASASGASTESAAR